GLVILMLPGGFGRAFGGFAGPFGLALVLIGRGLGHLGWARLVEIGFWRARRFGLGGRVPAAGGRFGEIIEPQAGRTVAGLAVGALGTRRIGVIALDRARRAALRGRRAGAALAG